jgi:hypothetical protein
MDGSVEAKPAGTTKYVLRAETDSGPIERSVTTIGECGQRWKFDPDWEDIDESIRDRLNYGCRVTELFYTDGQWAVVVTGETGYTAQLSRRSKKLSAIWEEVDKNYKDGFRTTSLTYNDGWWALVMSQETDYTAQSYRAAEVDDKFPNDYIREGWDNGYRITSYTWGDGGRAVVMSK